MFWQKKTITAMQQRIAELEADLVDRDATIAGLEQKSSIKNSEIRSLLHNWTHLMSEITHFSDLRNSLGLIRDSSVLTSETLDKEQSKLRETSSLFRQSEIILSDIDRSISGLGEVTRSSTRSVSELETATKNIEQFTRMISDISSQTNLLALNASIEAARAGDKGRGFAVVADEVRGLAGKTAEATTQIKAFVETINQQAMATRHNFDLILESSSSIDNSVDMVGQVIDEVVRLANDMTRVISLSTSRSFIETVKLDHVIYKTDIYQCIFGLSDRAIESFSDHHQCRLGQWYYQGDGLKLQPIPAYRQLEKPHKLVHQEGIKALVAKAEKRHEDCIAALHSMEAASAEVIRLLDDIEHDHEAMLAALAEASDQAGDQGGDIEMF